jgi:hypothetical protein
MAKRNKPADGVINSEGWMMSYADMATILLAMFIVLSTLGKDQTGVALYNGTGSFRQALDCFGLPGLFSTSSRAIQLGAPGPHFLSESSDLPVDRKKEGPHEDDPNRQRVIDGEQERLQHFLNEIQRQFRVERLPRITGQATVDLFDRLNDTAPHLHPRAAETIYQLVPQLRRSDYRMVVTVWATTPAESAWTRAAEQASQVVEEIAETAGLDAAARNRMVPVGQPWRFRELRRPVMSITIAKTSRD